MTIEDIQKRLDEIRKKSDEADDEVAHVLEDDLHQDVLAAIAGGECTDPSSCADMALKSNDIHFDRWHA